MILFKPKKAHRRISCGVPFSVVFPFYRIDGMPLFFYVRRKTLGFYRGLCYNIDGDSICFKTILYLIRLLFYHTGVRNRTYNFIIFFDYGLIFERNKTRKRKLSDVIIRKWIIILFLRIFRVRLPEGAFLFHRI